VSRPSGEKPVYSITVAAELVGLSPATLRLYESKGLLSPARSEGGTRRYSEDDIERLRRVAELQGDGVNLAGVGKVLDLENENDALRRGMAGDREDNTQPDRTEEQGRQS
jgi:MerR family transcriptional regulator, heat shock protein HspR